MRHNGGVPRTSAPASSRDLSPEDAARIARRYPRSRLAGPWGITLGVIIGAVFLAWTLWAGLIYANPDVAAMVNGFQATSDNSVTVKLDVQRADVNRPGVCTLTAVGTVGVPVGQTDVTVAAGGDRITHVTVVVKTTGRALSADAANCHIP